MENNKKIELEGKKNVELNEDMLDQVTGGTFASENLANAGVVQIEIVASSLNLDPRTNRPEKR